MNTPLKIHQSKPTHDPDETGDVALVDATGVAIGELWATCVGPIPGHRYKRDAALAATEICQAVNVAPLASAAEALLAAENAALRAALGNVLTMVPVDVLGYSDLARWREANAALAQPSAVSAAAAELLAAAITYQSAWEEHNFNSSQSTWKTMMVAIDTYRAALESPA